MVRFNKRVLLGCVALSALAGAARAEMVDASVEEVVVTAAGYEQQIAQAPASISVVSSEELARRPFQTLEDAVRDLEGVSINGFDPNSTDIVIRGMPGEYTMIMVDGRRQSTRETMNRGTGGVQAGLVPPLAAIDRIEVVRGPMSTLYGSDAMGGVVNIITRKVPERFSGSLTVGGIVQEDGDHGNSDLGDFWLGAPLADGRLGVQVYGSLSNRGEDDIFYPAPFTYGANGMRSHSLGAKAAYLFTPEQSLTLEGGVNSLKYVETPGRSAGPTAAKLEEEHERNHFSATYEGDFTWGAARLAAYRENEKLENRSNGVLQNKPDLTNWTIDALVTVPLQRHTLTLGGQYIDTKVTGIAAQDVVTLYPNTDKATRESWALFAEDRLQLTDDLIITGGARVDHYDQFGSHFTPRLYANYTIASGWTLRAGVAQGFKAPTLRQSTAEYCMTTGGGSLVRGPLCGNPDLEPETSTTFEGGVRYDGEAGRAFGVTLFHTKFKNKVVSFDSGEDDPRDPRRPLYIYDNVDRVRIQGVEITGAWPLRDDLMLKANYTYTDSERQGGGEPAFDGSSLDGAPLDSTPDHVLNGRLTWDITDRAGLYAAGYYTGVQYYSGFRNGALNTRKREPSTTFDLGGWFQLTDNVTLRGAVLNIADEIVPIDDRGRFQGLSGNWMVDEGRRFWASATVSF